MFGDTLRKYHIDSARRSCMHIAALAVASATTAAQSAQPPTSMAERTARERCGVKLRSARIAMGTALSPARNWKVSLNSCACFWQCLLLRSAHTVRPRVPRDRLFRGRREPLRNVLCRAKLSHVLKSAVPSATPRLVLQQTTPPGLASQAKRRASKDCPITMLLFFFFSLSLSHDLRAKPVLLL